MSDPPAEDHDATTTPSGSEESSAASGSSDADATDGPNTQDTSTTISEIEGTIDTGATESAGATTATATTATEAGNDRDGHVRVVGTAHVSEESVGRVERAIEDEQPDVVAVELDEGRYRQLKGDSPEDLDAGDLLRGNTVFQFLAYWMLSYVQSRLGDEFDIQPGADMMAAVETAESFGLGVALVDRDIQMTIQRFWARLRTREKLQLLASLPLAAIDSFSLGIGLGLALGLMGGVVAEAFAGPFVLVFGGPVLDASLPFLGTVAGVAVGVADWLLVGSVAGLALGVVLALVIGLLADEPEEDVEEFDIEQLTDTDVVTAMLEEFRRFSPGGAEALIDERDAFIAHKLVALREQGFRTVAVVGAGHQSGIEHYLQYPDQLPPMDSLVGEESGSRFSAYKLVGYLFTLGFLAFFVLLAMAGVRNGFLLRVFGAWFLINGIIAAALARVGGAHWTSASVGGAIAWLTSVNPLLAPGWFAGYVELRYLDVNVGDISRLNEIVSDETIPLGEMLDRLRAVPLFRLIAIVGLTNVGSMIASLLFAAVVLPYIAADVGGVGEVADLMVEGAKNSADLLWRAVS